MCKQELLKKIKTKGSLVMIENYVEEIMKEKYRGNIIEDEIFSLFEKVIELAKDLYEEDKNYQEIDITSIFSVLVSLCNKLQINLFEALKNDAVINLSKEFA